jgi:23S rRNA pseudouridine1911/1915/1917 synthase
MSFKKFLFSFTFIKQVLIAITIVCATLYLFIVWIGFTTNHGQEIVVPNLSKLTLEQAESKLDELDLDYELLDTVDYNADFPKLSIVQQDPNPGEKVKQNRVIYLKINSTGYSKVRIPDLIQKTYRQAVPTLAALGLEVGDTTYVPNLAKDMILEMKMNGHPIKAGQQVLKMTKVDLVLGDGKIGFEEEELNGSENDITTDSELDQELFEHHKFVATKGQSILRIDKYLMHLLENATRNKIQQAATSGNIFVNNIPVKSNYKVKPFDVVTIMLSHPPFENRVDPEDIPLDIVYEDDALLLINKPAGLVVHPGHGNYTGTLVNALAFHFQNLPLNSSERPGLVHRIDKDTTGLLVIAKTEQAMTHLAKQFENKTSEREYIAIVWGNVQKDEGTIEGNLARHLKDRMQMAVFADPEIGKPAITHYKVLERFGYITVISCKLETGRTHQIRAHLKHIGHPLFNDERYGGHLILKGTTFTKYKQFIDNCFKILPRQALHAKTLGFEHPTTKEMMRFDTNLPSDMQECIQKWRTYSNTNTLNEED